MKKRLIAAIIACVTLLLFSGAVSALQTTERQVRVLVYEDGVGPEFYNVPVSTVRWFLFENGYRLEPGDAVKPDLDAFVDQDTKVEITYAIPISIFIDGAAEPIVYKTQPGPVNVIARRYMNETGRTFSFDPALTLTQLTKGASLHLTSRESVVTVEAEEIPFETEYFDTDALLVGQERVIQVGAVGRKEMTTTARLDGGVETTRTSSDWQVVQAPTAQVVQRGTQPVPTPAPAPDTTSQSRAVDVATLDYTKVMDMAATAYTADYASTGKRPGDRGFGVCATGMKAQVGVIAVDPRVIPLYTKLYVDGYGFAVAGDTGGAIKGSIVDLFFDSPSEVREFGRQKVTVYVLADQSRDYFALER